MSIPEDNIEDNHAPCDGCPIIKECPISIGFMSKECKELLKAKGEM